MPLETIQERAISDVSGDSEYTLNRKNTNQDIAIHKLGLIGLNITKVMMDIKEDAENYKLMYDGCKLLQILAEDLNECVIFMNNEILNKKNINKYIHLRCNAELCKVQL